MSRLLTLLSQKSPQDSQPAASCGQSASDVEKARLAASGSFSARWKRPSKRNSSACACACYAVSHRLAMI